MPPREQSEQPFHAATSRTMSQVTADILPSSHNARTGCPTQHWPQGTLKRSNLHNASVSCAKHQPQYPESDEFERLMHAQDGCAADLTADRRGARTSKQHTARQSKEAENGPVNREGQQHENLNQAKKSWKKSEKRNGTVRKWEKELEPKPNCQNK